MIEIQKKKKKEAAKMKTEWNMLTHLFVHSFIPQTVLHAFCCLLSFVLGAAERGEEGAGLSQLTPSLCSF